MRASLHMAIIAVVLTGCGGDRSVPGGTAGLLLCDSEPMGDVQITIHLRDGHTFQPVGFAVTKPDGSFELLQPGAAGPLELATGAYACTLESVGAPLAIPQSYQEPENTPLQIQFDPELPTLELDATDVRLR